MVKKVSINTYGVKGFFERAHETARKLDKKEPIAAETVIAFESAALADPVEMIERGAPRIIHNDAELEQYTQALFNLTALENPTPPQQEAIELLTLLVERYEQTHYFIPVAGAVAVVKFLIEHQGLTQRDLIPQFGTESAVSMFLAGQRKLTLKQVQNLSARFKLPADIFIS
jgi:HTH-type transcriptional regulator/antitoxin HigA